MKTIRFMKLLILRPMLPKLLLLSFVLTAQLHSTAQVDWYQNQDGNNSYPSATNPVSIQPLGKNAFLATYIWATDGWNYTWKLSKTEFNGSEKKTFFLSGRGTELLVKTAGNNTVYVLAKEYPESQPPVFTLYKLDANFVVKAQRVLAAPTGYSFYNLSVFETDGNANLYFAGEAIETGTGAVSAIVVKTDQNLATKWTKTAATATAFTQLHIEQSGTVWVVEDYYEFYPDLRLRRISSNGQSMQQFTVQTDPNRYSLLTKMDSEDNLLIVGTKPSASGNQSMFLYQFTTNDNRIKYRKEFFNRPFVGITDCKLDADGNAYLLTNQYNEQEQQLSTITKIKLSDGKLKWSSDFNFATDSVSFSKLVMTDKDRFYAVGAQTRNQFFQNGYALSIKTDGKEPKYCAAPDSVAFQKLHYLTDGIADDKDKLVAIGSTTDFDPLTYSTTYIRAFAVRFENVKTAYHTAPPAAGPSAARGVAEEEKIAVGAVPLAIYPNPVSNTLNITGMQDHNFNQVTIYSLAGEAVLRHKTSGNSTTLSVSALPAGVYMVELQSSTLQKPKTFKIIISH